MSFKLIKTNQCAKCPWKVSTDPFEIPDGYSVEKHKALSETIAVQGSFCGTNKVMACHHSKEGKEQFCIGWLNHQLGIGNNIPLRLKMMQCENIGKIKTFGEQHTRFENTLPKTNQQ